MTAVVGEGQKALMASQSAGREGQNRREGVALIYECFDGSTVTRVNV